VTQLETFVSVKKISFKSRHPLRTHARSVSATRRYCVQRKLLSWISFLWASERSSSVSRRHRLFG